MIIGIIGASIILMAFMLLQTHVWKDSYFIYDFANFIGSILLVYYAISSHTYPFAVLNGVWAIVSLRDIFIDSAKKSKKR